MTTICLCECSWFFTGRMILYLESVDGFSLPWYSFLQLLFWYWQFYQIFCLLNCSVILSVVFCPSTLKTKNNFWKKNNNTTNFWQSHSIQYNIKNISIIKLVKAWILRQKLWTKIFSPGCQGVWLVVCNQ